ncbi:MAG: glycosyltransferase [Betaproteobacteria bacterium]|nr:glycosyltransferase [Betaproteobacteria bacterium]
MAAPSLTVAIVTYAPDMHWLARTLAYLAEAAHFAREQGTLGETRLVIVDNGPEGLADDLARLAAAALERAPGLTFEVASGHGNVGFARANNIALDRVAADLHLILNPDVEMETNALDAGLRYLAANPGVGAVTPAAHHPDGTPQYLVKAMPTWGVLFLRAFAPAFVRSWFKAKLDAYEMRERDWNAEQCPVEIASGCFLLCRRAALDAVKGFDPGYFLYFEDFDLTMRLSKVTRIAYVPAVRIVHHGGRAGSKGLRHMALFVRSASRFFRAHPG